MESMKVFSYHHDEVKKKTVHEHRVRRLVTYDSLPCMPSACNLEKKEGKKTTKHAEKDLPVGLVLFLSEIRLDEEPSIRQETKENLHKTYRETRERSHSISVKDNLMLLMSTHAYLPGHYQS